MKKLLLALALIPTIQAMQQTQDPTTTVADSKTFQLMTVVGDKFRVSVDKNDPTIADLFKAVTEQQRRPASIFTLTMGQPAQSIILNKFPETTTLKSLGITSDTKLGLWFPMPEGWGTQK